MKPKSIVTILLLVFVAVSVGYLVARESRAPAEPAKHAAVPTEEPGPQTVVGEDKGKAVAAATGVTNAESAGSGRISAGKKALKSAESSAAARQSVPHSKVVVYYFHGNTRCFTCRAIENSSRAAVGNGFPDELQKGRLDFLSVNVEEPANEHYVRDYQLVTRSVVLVRYTDGKQEKWKNLDRVWELVRDNDAFARYVQTETRQFLGGA